MRQLTSKVKYKLNEDGADLYSKNKETGKFEKVATCHESVVFAILDNRMSLRQAYDESLILSPK